MLDRAQHPLVAAYLDGLPEGLGSYPDCMSKASLVTSSLEGHDRAAIREGLPPEVQALIDEPLPASLWVSAVLTDCVFFAVCERHYPTVRAVHRWTYERTMAMAKNPIYRALISVPSPSVLIRMGAKGHGLLQRGTLLRPAFQKGRVELTLSFPPRLHVGLNLEANVMLWHALVELTGGKDVRSALVSTSDTEARYVVEYS